MLLNNLMISNSPAYYTGDFMTVIEANLEIIKNHKGTKTIPVTPELLAVYRGDCFSLLNELHIPVRLHWVTMRLSGMNSAYDFNERINYIYHPDIDLIDHLLNLHRQSPGKVGL